MRNRNEKLLSRMWNAIVGSPGVAIADERDSRLRTHSPSDPSAAELLRRVRRGEATGGVVVVANREPYSHRFASDGSVLVDRPVSGLVTGMEPMLRASAGTWIAHGSGSADQLTSDREGRLTVPPERPEYVLRRIWLDEAEFEHYYDGAANEALWPLCHMAHARPTFRPCDWIAYQAVNETFAAAAAEEAGTSGLLLVQDYHFALVPRLVRNRAAHVISSIFWHIPWPNAEIFAICPWAEKLLEGMLGADVIGFHTRQYCLNFLESVARHLECRVDLDEMSVTSGGRTTLVRPYPISVEWPYPAAARERGAALRRELGIDPSAHVSIAVDRADYTKGLLERVAAVELLLEENPDLAGRYVLVQLACPTRIRIRRYRELTAELEQAVSAVNARFGTAGWQPIILRSRGFSAEEVREHYAMADSALVTPLHDGMNLVAKEYAASCEDGDGVLVLSTLAGAAKELDGALLVNPYDPARFAQAILRAVTMPAAEKRARMQSMRAQIAAHTIHDWSHSLLNDMRAVQQRRARYWPQRPEQMVVEGREAAAG